jgi:hypothetical protein
MVMGALARNAPRAHIFCVRRDDAAPSSRTQSPMTQRQLSRTFTDSVGVEWTVREIATPEFTGTLARILEHDRRLGGWLVFDASDGEKRRLAPYPPDWRTMSEFEIERWCMRAAKVPPAPARRAED